MEWNRLRSFYGPAKEALMTEGDVDAEKALRVHSQPGIRWSPSHATSPLPLPLEWNDALTGYAPSKSIFTAEMLY